MKISILVSHLLRNDMKTTYNSNTFIKKVLQEKCVSEEEQICLDLIFDRLDFNIDSALTYRNKILKHNNSKFYGEYKRNEIKITFWGKFKYLFSNFI